MRTIMVRCAIPIAALPTVLVYLRACATTHPTLLIISPPIPSRHMTLSRHANANANPQSPIPNYHRYI